LRGLYISNEEIDNLSSGLVDGEGARQSESAPECDNLREQAQVLGEMLECRRRASQDAGTALPLQRLRALFGLTDFDTDVLLLCLAPELDRRYERLYGYLQDDVTKRSPTVGLALDVLCPLGHDPLLTRARYLADAPLLRHGLIRVLAGDDVPLLARPLKVDERIVTYLLGLDAIDQRLLDRVHWASERFSVEALPLAPDIRKALGNLMAPLLGQGELTQLLPVLVFQGPAGAGKRAAAAAVSEAMGLRLLEVDVQRLAICPLDPQRAIRLVFREARLRDAAVYWDNFDGLLATEDSDAWRAAFADALPEFDGLCFLGGSTVWEVAYRLPGITPVLVEFPAPSFTERRELWRRHLDDQGADVSEPVLSLLADKFRLTGPQIRAAVATASGLALTRGSDAVSPDDLHAACRLQSNQKLAALSHKLQPRYDWEDIVLPKDQLAQLRELCNYLKYRHVVYGDWGFDRKLSLGKGLNVLFSGPSGTGKTMAAEIIANELRLDLYKIDLSLVVSKYIGETEKNLDRIFHEAETSNAILFFDEADALFGKRSEVRDSHDRYANIEIAYLLQKMEEYEGVVILATNLRKNLDEAFQRRMHFSVDFPFPEEEHRRRIWGKVFPPAAPLTEDADLDFMARSFRITGGNIKNIALASAFLAAADGRVIDIEHLVRATKREYQKMGKLVVETDFGPYYELVKSD